MKKILSILTLSLGLSLESFVIKLPEGFCQATEIAEKKSCLVRQAEFTSKTPVFLILIHGTFSTADSFLNTIVFNNDLIPTGFFRDNAYDTTAPIRLSFEWSGENSDSARIQGGKKLAQGLNDIMQQCQQQNLQPATIIIAHSHGGNVVAVASNTVTQPIDCAIFLATPVLRYDQNKKMGNETDLYLPKKINNLFLFYSTLDIVQTSGALSNDFKRRYGPIQGINLYNTALLINGQEPGHSLYTQLMNDHILELCTKIKNTYTKNKNLVANIAPQNQAVDKIIAIKKYEPEATNPFTGTSTDSLWPNWENFSYSASEVDEDKASDDARMLFNNFYKFEFTDTMPFIDRSIKAIQMEVCTRAVGKMGATLALLPKEQKDSITQTCCQFDTFKTEHPNASAAVQCAKIDTLPHRSLSSSENQTFCMNVVGVPGRYLSLLPTAQRADLTKRCCSPAFKTRHPKAASALNCE